MLPPPFEGELGLMLARSVLGNPELMRGVRSSQEAAERAARIVREFLNALAVGPEIQVEELSDEEMELWAATLAAEVRSNARDTEPAVPSARKENNG